MSLDLATCEQLKAAGFPQERERSQWAWYKLKGCAPSLDFAVQGGRPDPMFADSWRCPTSDELLADMQRRWGAQEWYFIALVSYSENGDYTASAHGEGCKEDDKWHYGAEPAQALAALYLALAAKEQA